MLKKQQKWIALTVILAFAWMMQVSTMPLAAAGASERVDSASAGQGPNFVEVAGPAGAAAKSKSILPLVLIGVGVVAVAAVLFLVVLKTNYDILGSWTVNWEFTTSGGSSGVFMITFSGTKESGNITISYGGSGTYTVDGKNVTWVLSSEDPSFIWTGQFDSKDAMSGTINWSAKGASGTWTATRGASAVVNVKDAWNRTAED